MELMFPYVVPLSCEADVKLCIKNITQIAFIMPEVGKQRVFLFDFSGI